MYIFASSTINEIASHFEKKKELTISSVDIDKGGTQNIIGKLFWLVTFQSPSFLRYFLGRFLAQHHRVRVGGLLRPVHKPSDPPLFQRRKVGRSPDRLAAHLLGTSSLTPLPSRQGVSIHNASVHRS
jgi:hypothetical protein